MKQHIQKPKKSPALFLTLLSLIIMVFGILAGRSVVQNTTLSDSQAKTSTQIDNKIQIQSNTTNVVKVYYVKYIPKYDANTSIIQHYSWFDPDLLADQYINEVSTITHGRITYQIVEKKVIEDFTTLQNGHHFTIGEFQDCYARARGTCPGVVSRSGETVDYNKILTDTQACEKRNSGAIDELWINGPPYSGWWETIMTGPGSYENQTTPVQNTTCQKPMFIMGYNYEVGIPEMVHDLSHRAENALWHFIGTSTVLAPGHTLQNFFEEHQHSPQLPVVGCGKSHFPPNGTFDYDYANTNNVVSNCDDWLTFPNITPVEKTMNCTEWGCDQLGYYRWWFKHFPYADGTTSNGYSNNWWTYLAYGTQGPPPPANTPTVTPGGGGGGGGAGLSNSKLGIFILGSYSDGARKIIQAGPRVIKVLDPASNGTIAAVRDYKRLFPNGTVIMRVYVPLSVQYGLDKNPEDAATDFWGLYVKPEVDKLSASDKQLIDYLNGPNYQENFMANKLESDEELTWYSRFWTKYIDLVASYGMKTNMGEIYVAGLDKVHIPKIVGALQKLKEKNGIWSYHGYTLKYVTDTEYEKGFSLHYRTFYEELQTNYSDLVSLPMALTEGGVDCIGRSQDGWNGSDPEPDDQYYGYCGGQTPSLKRGNAEDYKTWLTWYDSQLRKDSYIKGITLFQIGDNSNSWRSGNIEPIADWFAQYLRGQGSSTTGTPPPNVSPTGRTGGGTTTLRVEVWVTRTGQTRRLWNASDGTAQVYIKGPTARGADRFSVLMNVPTSSGVFQDTEGHYFRGEPGVILWSGAGTSAGDPGGGTTPGRYTTKLRTLPTGLGPLPYPNVYATLSQGQTGVAILDVVEGNGPWPTQPPEPTTPPGDNPTPTPQQSSATPTPAGSCNCPSGRCFDDCSRGKGINDNYECRDGEGPDAVYLGNYCAKPPRCCDFIGQIGVYACCWPERAYCTDAQCNLADDKQGSFCGKHRHDGICSGGNANTSGYSNEDYARVIDQYANGEISALDVSRWISDATRSPGLQLTPCDPTTPGECEAK